MDAVIRQSTITVAVARLGLSKATVAGRRRELTAGGVKLSTAGGRGRPPGIVGPYESGLEVIRLFGLGHAPPEIARVRGTSRQAVHEVLRRYVFGAVGGRRWCCACLKPSPASKTRCPECGAARPIP
jgi:hypothetical protein